MTKESDLTGTVNGTSKIIGHQYKLVLSDFEQIRTAIDYNREFSDWEWYSINKGCRRSS